MGNHELVIYVFLSIKYVFWNIFVLYCIRFVFYMYLWEQKTGVSWHCIVFVVVCVFVLVIVIVCVFVFVLCCIWGNRGQEWGGMGGKSDNVTAGQGGHLYLGSGACRTTLYIQIYQIYSNIFKYIGAGQSTISRLRGVSYNVIYSNISVDRPLPRHTWDI